MPAETDSNSTELWESEVLVSDAIGQLIEFWGFKRNMGRVWSVLYLSPKPLNARDLKTRLQLSTGAVSMTINDLLRWGVVKKVWIQGERSDYFEAEHHLWKMISRVLRERELVEVERLIGALDRGLATLDARSGNVDGEERARSKVQRARIQRLREFARLGKITLDALIDHGRVDLGPLVRFLLGEESSATSGKR